MIVRHQGCSMPHSTFPSPYRIGRMMAYFISTVLFSGSMIWFALTTL